MDRDLSSLPAALILGRGKNPQDNFSAGRGRNSHTFFDLFDSAESVRHGLLVQGGKIAWSPSAEPLLKGTPSDSLFDSQWHLTGENGIRADEVWPSYTGAGVTIGFIDDGFEYTHPDLAANYDTARDYDALGGDGDAMAKTANWHGTSTMGVAGADDNGTGAVGVAFDANLIGIRIGFGAEWNITQLESAFAHALSSGIDILSNSWGIKGSFSDNFKGAYFSKVAGQLEDLVETGRGGLGISTVFAGRNDRAEGGSADYHNITNSPYTIAVAATDSAGIHTDFSAPGVSLLLSAPGQDIVTTDRTGENGYSAGDYVSAWGTSLAAPMVAGVIALMYEANPALGYRDVQEILAYSSRKTDAGSDGWQENGAGNWNGGGLHFSRDYGFGLLDAQAAVSLAKTWSMQQTYANVVKTDPVTGAVNLALPTQGTVVTTIFVEQDIAIEHVLIDLTIYHERAGDLTITLTGPDGTQSVLAARIDNGAYNQPLSFVFDSLAHWGESSAGIWTLMIEDTIPDASGILADWNLSFIGNEQSADDLYVYTDEFALMTGSRAILNDSDGGIDTINLSAIGGTDTVFDLNPGAHSLVAGNDLSIAAGTIIENAYTGAGNDTITGNAADNVLSGGGGNDMLYGGAGNDTYLYGIGDGRDLIQDSGGDDTLSFSAGIFYAALVFLQAADDLVIDIGGTGANVITIAGQFLADGLSAIETLLFADGTSVSLTLPPVNTNAAPTAQDDSFAILQGGILNGNVLAPNGGGADDDPDGDTLSVTANNFLTQSGGSVSLYQDGSFTYTSAKNFTGTDSFDYTLSDGKGGMDTGTVSILVEPPPYTVITGTSGANKISGTAVSEILYGLGGNDTLYGNGGDDRLYGGSGADSLYGGAGADIFVFEKDSAFTGTDMLRDFSTAQGDKIDISDLLQGYDPLQDQISDFVRIAASGKSGLLQVDPDGGANGFISVALIAGGKSLDAQTLFDQGALIV